MGSFANTVFSILLGWLQALTSMIWSALTGQGGQSLFTFIGEHWKEIALILVAAGMAVDFIVYLLRWEPYKVWGTFLRKISKKHPAEPDEPERPAERRAFPEEAPAVFPAPVSENRRPAGPASGTPEAGEDDLKRWREPEQRPAPEPAKTEVTRAGYEIPADSPYRRPVKEDNAGAAGQAVNEMLTAGRRRRIRMNLLGDPEEDTYRYRAPGPLIDQRDAYNDPVYPEQWKKGKDGEDQA